MLILIEADTNCCDSRNCYVLNTDKKINWFDSKSCNDDYGYDEVTCIFCGKNYAQGSTGKLIKIITNNQELVKFILKLCEK